LENLCISSISEEPEINCIEEYFNCLDEININYGSNHPHLYKAKVQVYLAKEEEGNIHMGIAADKNIWNWDNSTFEPIKNFIKSL